MDGKSPEEYQRTGKLAFRYFTVFEDIYALFTGKNFDGNDYNRGVAAGTLATGMLPVLKIGSVAGKGAKAGTTVLGHYPAYSKLALKLGVKRFNIPTNVWNRMTTAEQWSANQKFLDRMILRGDNIRLATPLNQVKPGSFYQMELKYLFSKGYKVSPNGLWLIK
ncbi:hypothetical protein M2132_000516 [Dysgonomonas sp. PH5-45]|uniref:hypothetical protein n=1 Tax=unclassified Dysgonomonas TaxID=2630389 RepID=UPI002476846C|nr:MULTISPECIES: hypothetical protein [unclassified Dysgonomonas]MDH6354189.1 hypothetical protein [Dysgonomonas sp. PH5-45]MDH6387090.1 hypothetical protein [Dysgonomonas sp. PH5-37]